MFLDSPQLRLVPPLLCIKRIPSRLLLGTVEELYNSIPYIKHLISKGTDILVLQEHWLWPFELDQLESIDPNYTHTAVCDNRLSPMSTLRRGCGGCAILWKKTIPANLVSIDPNYTHTAVCDNRLSPTSTLRRGCGGCAILWKKTIPATLVSPTVSVASNSPLRARTQHSPLLVPTCLALISLKRFTMLILPPLTKPLPKSPPLPHC